MARKFGNMEIQRTYDSTHGGGKSAEPKTDEPVGEHEGESSNENVVEEHGKANEITIKHNHEAGEHHVHSKHADGHSHHAKFGSAGEAHQHASKMAGVEPGQEEEMGAPAGGEDRGAQLMGM